MSLRRDAAQSLADSLGRLMTLAQQPTVIAAPPSDVVAYPALAVQIDKTTVHLSQNWDLEVNTDSQPMIGNAATLEGGSAVADLGLGSRLARIGTLRCQGRIWVAARVPAKREEMEEKVIAAFMADPSAPGTLYSTLTGVQIGGLTLPWSWTVATSIDEQDATWTQEYVFSERVWSWLRINLDVDLLVPRADPLVEQFILEISVGVDDNPDDLNAPVDETLVLNNANVTVTNPGPGPSSGLSIVYVDNTTISGDGTLAHPLHVIGDDDLVSVDGTTIAGDGTPGNPLHIVAADDDTIFVDGTTIGGAGTSGSPLTLVGSILGAQQGGTPTVAGVLAMNFVGDVTVTDAGAGVATINISALAQPNFWVDVTLSPYFADKTGVVDATSAIQSAITAANTAGKPVYFPKGTYKLSQTGTYVGDPYCLFLSGITGLTLIGNGALFTYPSQSAMGFYCLSCANLTFTGLKFQGANDDNKLTNNRSAIYFPAGCEDNTITRCEFTKCPGISAGTDGVVVGRMMVSYCRFHEVIGGVSCPFRSEITNCIFDATSQPGSRSHYIYIFGPADGCLISGNIFRHSDNLAGTNAIQIRAGTARYNLKRGFTITGNEFYQCNICCWLGSDDNTCVSAFTVTGNNAMDSNALVRLMGCRNATVSGNTCEYTWEHTIASPGAFEAQYVSGLSSTDSITFSGNTVVNRHPWYGTINVGSQPTAGDTVVVGAQTYTWRASASVSGEVTIGANTTASANNLATEIRGAGLTPINKILRDPTDVLYDQYTYDGSVTTQMTVVGAVSFALSRTGTAVTVSAVVDNTNTIGAGFLIQRARWVRVSGNTLQDVYIGVSSTACMGLAVENNTFAGSSAFGHGNVFSTWRNNNFQTTPTREAANYRWMQIDDGFPIIDGNGMGQIASNESQSNSNLGCSGIIPVGDGKARCRLYYGVEQLQGGSAQPETLHWRWDNGDQVVVSDGISVTYTFTFQRTSPGANQFNTADTLLALINGSTAGNFSAAYVPFINVGSTTNPKMLIEITHVPGGVAGNSGYVRVLRTQSTGGLDSRSLRMCGVLLIERKQTHLLTERCFFQGGSAAADKTVIWSPVASDTRGGWVGGYDATSQALAPAIYPANIIEGVCAIISHAPAAGTESFIFRLH